MKLGSWHRDVGVDHPDSDSGLLIALCGEDHDPASQMDAQLISCAPDMLKALEKAEKLLEKHSVDATAFRKKLHFLIKKAKGEA
jgi:hypothetical protein